MDRVINDLPINQISWETDQLGRTMHYIWLVAVPLMWSFVGILVKTASTMVGSSVITLSRFLFGALFLAILILARKGKLKITWKNSWIWLGVGGKSVNYLTENIALRMGAASGNMVVMPLQAVFMAVVAVMFYKEKMTFKKVISIVLCVLGSLIIGLRGRSLTVFFQDGLIPLVLFFLAAIGAGLHVISQKKLIATMDSADMNFSVFFFATIAMSVPVPFSVGITGITSFWAIFSLVMLGFITGISFLIYAKALKHVSLLVASLVGNSSVLFILLWAWLFFGEPITPQLVFGAAMMVVGLIMINLPFPGDKVVQ